MAKSRNVKKIVAGVVIGAAVVTAIAVPLAARNSASKNSTTTKTNTENSQVSVSVSGCADGQREWFRDSSVFTDIAGCSGQWTVKGLVGKDSENLWPVPITKTGLASCATLGDDSSANSAGTGCNGADLCAAGWHLCSSQKEVSERTGSSGCDTTAQSVGGPWGFFAAAQTGNGFGNCDALANSFNDIFGCGDDGATPASNCAPLNKFTNDVCSSVSNGWSCGSNGYNESMNIVHSSNIGGVLCCKDQPAAVCTASATGWTVSGVSDYASYVVKSSSYTGSCVSVSGSSVSITEATAEFTVSFYRNSGACANQRPDEVVTCLPYVPENGDNEYGDYQNDNTAV